MFAIGVALFSGKPCKWRVEGYRIVNTIDLLHLLNFSYLNYTPYSGLFMFMFMFMS